MTETSGGSNYGGSSYETPTGDTNGGDSGTSPAKEWMGQLQSMIDNVATHAGPVMRDIAAKAAELAAVAGEKAGPIAHKAAEVTESAGAKLAERGREVAAELRRDAASTGGGAAEGDVPNAIEPAPTSTMTATPEAPTSRTDSLGE
jgi:hypothetical protein